MSKIKNLLQELADDNKQCDYTPKFKKSDFELEVELKKSEDNRKEVILNENYK